MITTAETTDPAVRIEDWHIHRGTHRYYLCGPGSDAMHPCSAPVYEGRHPTMTPEETRIGHAALALLTERHSQDKDAGVPEIKAALADAAAGIKPRRQQKAKSIFRPHSSVTISADQIARVSRAVIAITGCTAQDLCSEQLRLNSTNRAKHLHRAACLASHPGLQRKTLQRALGLSEGTVSSSIRRHQEHMERDASYRSQFQQILTALR